MLPDISTLNLPSLQQSGWVVGCCGGTGWSWGGGRGARESGGWWGQLVHWWLHPGPGASPHHTPSSGDLILFLFTSHRPTRQHSINIQVMYQLLLSHTVQYYKYSLQSQLFSLARDVTFLIQLVWSHLVLPEIHKKEISDWLLTLHFYQYPFAWNLEEGSE